MTVQTLWAAAPAADRKVTVRCGTLSGLKMRFRLGSEDSPGFRRAGYLKTGAREMEASVLVFAQVVLGTTFALSSVQKARAVPQFKDGLSAFGIPRPLRAAVAVTLIALEMIASCLMLLPWVPLRAGLFLCAALLIAFSIALIRAIETGAIVDCHCFGARETAISWFDVLRNMGLLALVLVAWVSLANATGTTQFALVPEVMSSVRTGDLAIAVVAAVAVVLALLWAHLPEIAALAMTEPRIGG
ncbi:MAG TPA: MauE/DoxX family redox-associated membrane protein [Candidatus Dormibacteraeota bacterium]